MTCGLTKVVLGRREPLVCNLDANHEGDCGIRQLPTLPPYVTWRRS